MLFVQELKKKKTKKNKKQKKQKNDDNGKNQCAFCSKQNDKKQITLMLTSHPVIY